MGYVQLANIPVRVGVLQRGLKSFTRFSHQRVFSLFGCLLDQMTGGSYLINSNYHTAALASGFTLDIHHVYYHDGRRDPH